MKKFLKSFLLKTGAISGLLIVSIVLGSYNPTAALLMSLSVSAVSIVALFRPLPAIGLGNRGFSIALLFFIGLFAGVGSFGLVQEEDRRMMAALRLSDPNAYLAALERNDEAQWLKELETLDPERFATETARQEEAARLVADATAKEEARQRRIEEAQRRAETATREAEARARAEGEAEARRYGKHCLSSWDSSHREFAAYVRDHMRNPDSFEVVENRITPVDENGMNTMFMTYRAENGFGGLNVATAVALVNNATCEATVLAIEK